MKKALLLLSILFLSVISTACINNFAVQELNSKAQSFMEQGDYNAAIERLKSSLDLDDTIFETHYNLAVAYTKAENYLDAIEQFKITIDLNPDFVDSYYSLAVAENNLIVDLKNGTVRIDEAGKLYTPVQSDLLDDSLEYKPSDEILSKIDEYKADALANFKIYLDKAPNNNDVDEVKVKIKELSGESAIEE